MPTSTSRHTHRRAAAFVAPSLWPAGINTSAPGTVQWAGGMINWNDPDYQSAGTPSPFLPAPPPA